MRKVLKWIGIVLGVLVGLLAIAVAVVGAIGYQKLTNSQQYKVSETSPCRGRPRRWRARENRAGGC
jgi:hypothetical protein